MPPPPPPPSPTVQPSKPKKKGRKAKKKRGFGAKCFILLHALHPQALIEQKHPKKSRTNEE